MKHLFSFIILNLSFIIPSAGQVIFHENFEFPDSVISSSGLWSQNQRLQTSGLYCDSSAYGVNDVDTLTTIAFSTVGYNGVFLSFNHICKIEFFDEGYIEVSPDSGLSWIRVCYQGYMGGGLLQSQGCKFTEASYATWDPGTNGVPDNSWWKPEAFDLTAILFNCTDAMVRFVLKDNNMNGMVGRAGWFLDDLMVTNYVAHAFVTGTAYFDSNSNSIKDPGESGMANRWVIDTVNGKAALTSGNGTYFFSYIDTVNTSYAIEFPPLNYYNILPSSHSGNITAIGQIDSLRDFAVQSAGTFNDLCVAIGGITPFRSGMNASYSIVYRNVGTTSISPTVIFYPDTNLTFVSSNPAPSVITSDSIVWNFGSMGPFQIGYINITVNVATGLPFNTLINSGAVIEPIAGDANTQCNQSWVELFTSGSYDPNDISVSEDTVYTFELASPPYLDYLIRFQNTGNDTAFHVQVLNEIPGELDFFTFELMDASHPVDLDYHSGLRLMVFDFASILLPDSNVNEPASHGYIWYRIKPMTNLTAGDSIESTAAIYFDYNDPVTTNTAVTEIVLPTGTVADPMAVPVGVTVFPNPSDGELNLVIEGMKGELVEVEVYNLMGKRVAVLFMGMVTSEKHQMKHNLTGFPEGMYIIRLLSEKCSVQNRVIKM